MVDMRDDSLYFYRNSLGYYQQNWRFLHNPETGEKGYKEVKQLFLSETTELIHLTVEDTEIKATPEHPFYVEGKDWVEAKDLQAGDSDAIASLSPQNSIDRSGRSSALP